MTEHSREGLAQMLVERGVTNAESIVGDLRDDQMEGAYGSVLWWDSMPHEGARAVSTGLLVNKVKEGLVGYRPPAERTGPSGTLLASDALLGCVRRVLLSPDACFDRQLGRDQFLSTAKRLNMPVDQLIDAAVGPEWARTPPHPAMPNGWASGDWIAKDGHVGTRYRFFVAMEAKDRGRCDTKCLREPRESDWSWACRFWGWQDPQEITDLILRVEQERAEEIAERQARVDAEHAERLAAAARDEAEQMAAAVAAEDDAW